MFVWTDHCNTATMLLNIFEGTKPGFSHNDIILVLVYSIISF